MSLTIENPETERLAAEVAQLAGESQTEAIRKSLEERKLRLVPKDAPAERIARLRNFLEKEVWPNIPPEVRGRQITREEEDEILGYGPGGV